MIVDDDNYARCIQIIIVYPSPEVEMLWDFFLFLDTVHAQRVCKRAFCIMVKGDTL